MLKKNLKGITLIEVFIASFIFIISVSAVFSTLITTRRPAINNEQELQGALVLRNKLEFLRSKVDTRHIAFGTGIMNNELSEGTHIVNSLGPGGIYNIIYNVTRDSTTGVLEVNATAYWPDSI